MRPRVVRRIEAALALRLDRLHLVRQAALGWTNSHLYELRAEDVGWGIPDPAWKGGPLDARKARLDDVLEDIGTRTLRYLYDLGDGWEHTIKIERAGAPVPGVLYPRLLDATGRCPPEHVGGAPGYDEFLAALADPKHESHAEFTEWVGPGAFDPHLVDLEALAGDVQALAKRWQKKPAVKRKLKT